MKKYFQFVADLDSVPFTRPARATYVLTKDRKFREDLAWIAGVEMKVQQQVLFTTPLKVTVELCRKVKTTSRRFGDVDNHIKNICDALNNIVWKDDSLITEMIIKKNYSINPHIKIRVEVIK